MTAEFALLLLAVAAPADNPPCRLPTVQQAPGQGGVSVGSVAVGGAVSRPFTLRAEEAGRFATLRARVSQPSAYGPIDGVFEGISVAGLIAAATPATPAGKAGLLSTSLTARAGDGYAVAFSYAEIDPDHAVTPAFLAFRCNGRSITPTLVAPGDRNSDRYVHELTAIELILAPAAGASREAAPTNGR